MDSTCSFRRRAAAAFVFDELIHKWLSPSLVNSAVGMDMSDIGCRNPSIFHTQLQDFQYLPKFSLD